MSDPVLAWADILDSDKYMQGRNVLRNSRNEYCCIGVAVEEFGYGFVDKVFDHPPIYEVGHYETVRSHDYSMAGRSDFPDEMEVLADFINDHGMDLAELNDACRLDFWQIAQRIREWRKLELETKESLSE